MQCQIPFIALRVSPFLSLDISVQWVEEWVHLVAMVVSVQRADSSSIILMASL